MGSKQNHKATHEDDKSKLHRLDRFLAGRELESINRALIDTIKEAKWAEGCANGTVHRTVALLRAILRRFAREWEWTDRSPAIRLLKELTRRIPFLTRERVLHELPPQLRAMAAFALSIGLRRANDFRWHDLRHTWASDSGIARRIGWVRNLGVADAIHAIPATDLVNKMHAVFHVRRSMAESGLRVA